MFGLRLTLTALCCSVPAVALADLRVTEVGQLTPPINVEQLVFDAPHQLLIARNTASTIAVIKTSDGSSTLHPATYQFTDLSLSPQGGVLYAADYGGEQIGYGEPLKQHYVHRLDLSTRSWAVQKATLAGNIEAVSDETFVLKSNDQWVTFTYNAWGSGTAVMQLNTNTNAQWSGYYAGVYAGNFIYAPQSGRLVHGELGISSPQLTGFKIVANEFAKQESTGYGAPYGGGPTLCLSTDGSTVYTGAVGVDTLDVTHRLRTFAAPIYAATPDVAFAKDDYYDVHTTHQVDSLGFPSTVYALNTAGTELWAYDAAATKLHHYVITTDGTTPVVPDAGAADASVVDASVPDASVPDASVPDASVADAGAADASKADSAAPDAGAVEDAAAPEDSATPPEVDAAASETDAAAPPSDDAGPLASDDAGGSDELDAGTQAPDAAIHDAAIAHDANVTRDGGVVFGPAKDGCALGSRADVSPLLALALLLLRRRSRNA